MKKGSFSGPCAYVALVISLVLLSLWCCNAGGFSVVNLDSFVGVIVALLAIMITIVLGWQIFNSIELKQKIQELDKIKKQFQEQQDTVNQLSIQTYHRMNATWGDISNDRKNYVNAFSYYLVALKYSLSLNEPLNITSLKMRLEFTSKNIKKGMNQDQDLYQSVINNDQEIRNSSNYQYIENWYEPMINKSIDNINIQKK